MKNVFYEYLKTLNKDELIKLIYNPFHKIKNIQYKSYRNIALRISYNGEKYSGLSEYKYGDTIGNRIKNALLLSTLGENIVYAGRTDKGVSAVNMIASVKVKSLLSGNTSRYELTQDDEKEFNYETLLNNYLPHDIRITGWAPVEDNFNARFSCIQRKYRYYFYIYFDEVDGVKQTKYDINKMSEMCQEIKNLKNFYHLSKHSDKNARYNRTVDVCKIVKDGDLYYLDIQAKSFLHNMVRKIFWLIEKAGKNEEIEFEKIGTADPDNLIFFEAVYPVKLNFLLNKLHNDTWQKIYSTNKVRQKLCNLFLESQNKKL